MEKYIVSGEFTSSSLNVQGYSLVQIGKGTVKSEKFKERSEVNFDPERLLDALQNKGKVYAYKKKGIVKSLYVVRRTENRYSCNEIFYAPDIMDEPVKDLMDAGTAYLPVMLYSFLMLAGVDAIPNQIFTDHLCGWHKFIKSSEVNTKDYVGAKYAAILILLGASTLLMLILYPVFFLDLVRFCAKKA